MTTSYLLVFVPIVLSILYTAYVMAGLRKSPSGNAEMTAISKAIQAGSQAYLNRQYKSVAAVGIVAFALIGFFLHWITAIGFLVGAITSALAGYIGMNVAVRSNAKTAEAAKSGMSSALSLAFRAGSVTGLLVVSLALLAVAGFYFITKDIQGLIGLGFGASLISIFARLGGGIFTKAADVGADLVGKVEADIPEDDPRNPAVIADNVGDNVGDCAGMAAALFETYAVTMIAAMFLASLLFPGNMGLMMLPLLIGAVAVLCSIAGSFLVRMGEGGGIMAALYRGLGATSVLTMALLWPLFSMTIDRAMVNPLFISALIGIAVTGLMVLITEYYTSKKFRPVKSIAHASLSGHGTNMIMGLAFSLEATALPIIVISGGMMGAYLSAGLFGVAIAAVAMLSMAGREK